jgi:hypothetical protein
MAPKKRDPMLGMSLREKAQYKAKQAQKKAAEAKAAKARQLAIDKKAEAARAAAPKNERSRAQSEGGGMGKPKPKPATPAAKPKPKPAPAAAKPKPKPAPAAAKPKPTSGTQGSSMPSNPPGMRQTRGKDLREKDPQSGLYINQSKPSKRPSTPKKGDVKREGGQWKRWDGTKWVVTRSPY